MDLVKGRPLLPDATRTAHAAGTNWEESAVNMIQDLRQTAPRPVMRPRLHPVFGKLGPMPAASLRAMVGYGLNEAEIGRYFGVTPSSVRRLKRSLGVCDSAAE